MAFEPDEVAKWITQRLTTNSAITAIVGRHPTKGMWQVYQRVVPQGGTYPCVLFASITGNYTRGTGGYRIFARLFYEIKAINTGESYSGSLSTLANLIDQSLQQAQDVSSSVVAGCSAVRPIQREDYDGNERHNHYGNEYEIWAYAQSDDQLGGVTTNIAEQGYPEVAG